MQTIGRALKSGESRRLDDQTINDLAGIASSYRGVRVREMMEVQEIRLERVAHLGQGRGR